MDYRRGQADSLWRLAQEHLDRNELENAYQLAHEVLRESPDHEQARAALGFRKVGKRWVTRETDRPRVIAGRTPHPLFGWRRNQYWRAESAHFRVTTNRNPAAAIELLTELEELYAVWRQLFVRFWTSPQALRARFEGAPDPAPARVKHEVVLFRDREEYVNQLSPAEPQIEVTLGYYAKAQQKAFFYLGEDSLDLTRFHEVTHQLFQESGDAVSDPAEIADFWIIEGIAVYMESLRRHDGYYTAGGFEADRLQYARARRLSGQFYMPLAELVRLGREDLQNHAELRRLYSQSAGLAHFLMDDQGGRFRGPLVDYLTLIYLGRAGRDTLAQRCGQSLEELDSLYASYLDVNDDDLQRLPPGTVLRNLSLGRTSVTDHGLTHLAKLPLDQLSWLDVSFTGVTDAGLANISEATAIRQLNLEDTRITDSTLEIIGRFRQLEELDLSGTGITDAGVAYLESSKDLRVLWLTNTKTTDAALPYLERLGNLEMLDVQGTQITPEGLRHLQERLPKLCPDTGS
jgi:hypothetical protein